MHLPTRTAVPPPSSTHAPAALPPRKPAPRLVLASPHTAWPKASAPLTECLGAHNFHQVHACPGVADALVARRSRAGPASGLGRSVHPSAQSGTSERLLRPGPPTGPSDRVLFRACPPAVPGGHAQESLRLVPARRTEGGARLAEHRRVGRRARPLCYRWRWGGTHGPAAGRRRRYKCHGRRKQRSQPGTAGMAAGPRRGRRLANRRRLDRAHVCCKGTRRNHDAHLPEARGKSLTAER